MKKYTRIIVIALTLAISLSSCILYRSPATKDISDIPADNMKTALTIGDISLYVRATDPEQNEEIFGDELYSKGIQPYIIHISNNSEGEVYYNPRSFPYYIPPERVYDEAKTNHTGTAIGGAIAGTVLTPFGILGLMYDEDEEDGGISPETKDALLSEASFIISGLFWTGWAIAYTASEANANSKLEAFLAKDDRDMVPVLPGKDAQILVFSQLGTEQNGKILVLHPEDPYLLDLEITLSDGRKMYFQVVPG